MKVLVSHDILDGRLSIIDFINGYLHDVIRIENDTVIRLYRTGEYWNAFEQSAFWLCHQSEESQITLLRNPVSPFPVVMATIPNNTMLVFRRKHIFQYEAPGYCELVGPKLSSKQYGEWHHKEVASFMSCLNNVGSYNPM